MSTHRDPIAAPPDRSFRDGPHPLRKDSTMGRYTQRTHDLSALDPLWEREVERHDRSLRRRTRPSAAATRHAAVAVSVTRKAAPR